MFHHNFSDPSTPLLSCGDSSFPWVTLLASLAVKEELVVAQEEEGATELPFIARRGDRLLSMSIGEEGRGAGGALRQAGNALKSLCRSGGFSNAHKGSKMCLFGVRQCASAWVAC